MTLGITLPNPTNLFLRLQSVFSNPLGQQAAAYREQRKALKAGLENWANGMMAARRAYLTKTVSIDTLSDEAQRLALLDNDTFYTEIIYRFRRAGFEAEARHYDEIRKRGSKSTKYVKDENGNVTGSETVTDGEGLSNAVEFSF